MAVLDEALSQVDQSDERWWEAELYRVRGVLLLKQENEQTKRMQAEGCFQRAIDIAQKQAAKPLELRAATSLARLWQSQGKTTEARDLLASVYEWFTEGFDTADLKDAKALLEVLSEGQ